MQKHLIDLQHIKGFSQFILDYTNRSEDLKAFVEDFPSIDAIVGLAEKRTFDQDRDLLVDEITFQYREIENAPKLTIEKLRSERTFTVTTGHQLNIFAGPLFLIYKIVTTINLAKKLSLEHPRFQFVPVYWLASEDHDFQEINHFYLNGERITWDSTFKGGPVGSLSTDFLVGLESKWKNIPSFFFDAYKSGDDLASAVRHYINHLFGEEGLVVLDANSAYFKKQFINHVLDDLFQHKAFDRVNQTIEKLSTKGYSSPVNPRTINLFYLRKDLRERIEHVDGYFQIVNTTIRFTEEEIRKELNQYPERFSPNVLLRPLYQEVILPNVVYVGGPSEIEYWAQLKDFFLSSGIQFPVLLPRNFAAVFDKRSSEIFVKLQLKKEELFQDFDRLKKQFVNKNGLHELSLAQEIDELNTLFNKIGLKAKEIDTTLNRHILAEYVRAKNRLLHIEDKLRKAEERHLSDDIRQLKLLQDTLYPEGVLQERRDSYINFYLKDKEFVNKLLKNLDPLDSRFNLFCYQ